MRRLTLAIVIAGMVLIPFAWPCGPFFPHSYLVFGGKDVLEMPAAMFSVESRRILDLGPAEDYESPISEAELRERTLETDLSDLSEIAAGRVNLDPLIAEYRALREALNDHANNLVRGEREWWDDAQLERYKRDHPFDAQPFEVVIAKLPIEFTNYIRGAIAYHSGDYDGAIEHFSDVLALPADRRQYRSVWAAFMTGKSLLRTNPGRAATFFVRTRELAQEGFRDPLELASASIGWQARAEMLSGNYVDAIHQYAAFAHEPGAAHAAVLSLGTACDRALSGDGVDPALTADELSRELIAAWLASRPSEADAAKKWLAALNVTPDLGVVSYADHMAWVAYESGEMDLAKQWLEHSAPDAPQAQWVQAKLYLREGKHEDAAAILKDLADTFPEGDDYRVDSTSVEWLETETPRNLIRDDLAYVLIAEGDYAGALTAFLGSGSWADAAYVAERLMTVAELKEYVQSYPEDAPPEETDESAEEGWGRGGGKDRLSYLLARRLARLGKWNEALSYYPENASEFVQSWWSEDTFDVRTQAAAVADHLQKSEKARRSSRERAEALFVAGRILSEYGMELMGAELEPDFAMFAGNYEIELAIHPSNDAENGGIFDAEMRKRFEASAPTPAERFHYRYVAAAMLWQCAELLPNNDPLTAHALYRGGMLLKSRDPDEADNFYKALVRRNPNLLIAVQADKLRWFPKEFTDTVLYEPIPWFTKRKKAAAAALIGIVAVVGGLAIRARRRARRHAPLVDQANAE